MLNRRILVILKREILTRLFSKAFIIMTLLIPLFMFGIIGFQVFVNTYESDHGTTLKIVAPNTYAMQKFQAAFAQADVVKNGTYKISFDTLGGKTGEAYTQEYKEKLLQEKLNGIFIVPEKALENKEINYYSTNPNNPTVFGKVRSVINEVLIDMYFKDRSLSKSDKEFVRKGVNFESFRVTKNQKIEEEGSGNLILSFIFTFFLYFSLLMIGTNLMRSVIEEKSSKIVEVILSSVNAKELMIGKILGTAITGLVQMAIWLIPIVVVAQTSLFALPENFQIKVDLWMLGYFLYNFVVSLVTYLGIFAAVGAMFDSDQDAQSGMWPVMILIMIPFFIAMGLPARGDNSLSMITSMLPFTALMVMPARLALISVPAWQVLVSIVVNIGLMLTTFSLAGKIYRVGILATGKKATYQDLVKWLKIK
ncbi:MAG: ABC transporter permease [Ignavibacteria bacterium]|nr:ABC transporter permease [Ignavibacteria bacterium]